MATLETSHLIVTRAFPSRKEGGRVPWRNVVRVNERPHLVVPYSLVTNDAKFIRGSIATANQYFEFLRDSFDMLYREGAAAPRMMSVGLHLRIVGHPGRAAGLERFLDHDRVWICRRSEIASHWHSQHRLPV